MSFFYEIALNLDLKLQVTLHLHIRTSVSYSALKTYFFYLITLTWRCCFCCRGRYVIHFGHRWSRQTQSFESSAALCWRSGLLCVAWIFIERSDLLECYATFDYVNGKLLTHGLRKHIWQLGWIAKWNHYRSTRYWTMFSSIVSRWFWTNTPSVHHLGIFLLLFIS